MNEDKTIPLCKKRHDKETVYDDLQAALDIYQYHGNKQSLCIAMKQVIKASGGITLVASRANIRREHLSYMLSGRCDPRLETVIKILKAINCHVQICVRD